MAHSSQALELPPGQQLVAADKWPPVGERAPAATTAPWRLMIGGLVERSLELSFEQLYVLPLVDREIDIHCVTRWSKLGVRFRGIELAELLAYARPAGEARFVSFIARSDRRHSTSLPLADAISLGAFVAIGVAGQPLPVQHGGPRRLVVPGPYFYKSLKWLAHIELLGEDRLGYWESTAGYHNHADYLKEERYLASSVSAADARAILSKRDIRGRELMGLNAAGLALPALRAEGALLRNADFRGAILTGACFDGANLTNAHFEQAQLQGASFRGADLEGANFGAANLSGACLLADSMVATSFSGSRSVGGAILDASSEILAARCDDLAPAELAFLQQQPLRFQE